MRLWKIKTESRRGMDIRAFVVMAETAEDAALKLASAPVYFTAFKPEEFRVVESGIHEVYESRGPLA